MTAGGSNTPPVPGPLANLVHDVGQPAGAVLALVLPQGVAGALERPVGVELAEDVVLVGAGQRWAASRERAAAPSGGVRRRRRKRRGRRRRRTRPAAAGARRRRLPSPIRGRADGRGGRLERPLEPEPLQDVSPGRVQVAQFDRVHRVPSLGRVIAHIPYTARLARAKRVPRSMPRQPGQSAPTGRTVKVPRIQRSMEWDEAGYVRFAAAARAVG